MKPEGRYAKRKPATAGRWAAVAAWIGLGTAALALPACGDDTAESFTLVVRADRMVLLADGSNAATMNVTVLDQAFNPAPFGSEVTLVASPEGNVNDTGTTAGRSQTDPLGNARFTVACTSEQSIIVQARFGDERGTLRGEIECRPAPTGDWTIDISADPRRITPGSSSALTVVARDSRGQPVGETPVRLTITGNAVTFSANGLSQLQRTTDSTGRIPATSVVSSTAEGTASVCAQFVDGRLGGAPSCVSVVVSERQVTGAACIGTFSSGSAAADGRSVTTTTISVTNSNGGPVTDAEVRVQAAAGTFVEGPTGGPLGSQLTLFTDTSGDVEAFLRSPSDPAAADVVATATYVEDGETRTLACEFSESLVFFGAPQCRFDGMTPNIIGVTSSGIDEIGNVKFCFAAADGTPVNAGRRVDFTWDVRLNGAEFTARSTLTDAAGCAAVDIQSGTQAGLVDVRATLAFGDSNSTCASGPLPIRGGRPTERGMVLTCSQRGANALIESAGSELWTSCEVPCWLYLRDRFGNPVNDPDTQVFFASEQGTVTSPVRPDANGRVQTSWRPNGILPSNVEPLDDEPRFVDAETGETVNPRDMYVSIIAWTNGEEGFFDANGNGAFDDGELFIDRPEPFVDVNDNDTYEEAYPFNERFIDVQTPDRELNGEWDDINGQWDSNTTIWTSTTAVLVDLPVWGSLASVRLVRADPTTGPSPSNHSYYARLNPDDSVAAVFPFGTEVTVPAFDGARIGFVAFDRHYNQPALGADFGMEGACGGLLGSGENSDIISGRGTMEYERYLQAYDRFGNEVFEDDSAEYLQWRTRMYRGGDNVRTKAVANPAGAGSRCEGAGAQVAITVTDECTDVTITTGFPTIFVWR